MMTDRLLAKYLSIVEEAGKLAFQHLFDKNNRHILRIKPDGDTTREVDVIVEEFIKDQTELLGLRVRYVSEESAAIDLNGIPEYMLFLDPIDGTDMAVRGYPLCSIALSLHRIDSMETVLAINADIFQNRIYYASKEGAFVWNGRERKSLKPSGTRRIEDAFLVSYAAKPYRMLSLLKQKDLISQVSLFLNYGGPLDITKVGAGSVDAFIEFQKGFKVIDFAAGTYIAEASGAIVSDLEGKSITIPRDLNTKQKLLVSCNQELHEVILKLLNRTTL